VGHDSIHFSHWFPSNEIECFLSCGIFNNVILVLTWKGENRGANKCVAQRKSALLHTLRFFVAVDRCAIVMFPPCLLSALDCRLCSAQSRQVAQRGATQRPIHYDSGCYTNKPTIFAPILLSFASMAIFWG
jgi:hypothetical protein